MYISWLNKGAGFSLNALYLPFYDLFGQIISFTVSNNTVHLGLGKFLNPCPPKAALIRLEASLFDVESVKRVK